MNSLSLEENRRGYFLPETNIDSGWIVFNNITNEYYLTVAVYPEVYNENVLSLVSHMFVCNAIVTISGFNEDWDDYGNKKTVPINKVENARCYLQHITAGLRQYDSGLHPDAQYIIYISKCDVQLLDTIELISEIQNIKMKIIDINNFSFPGISKIQVRTETRG